MSYQHIEVRCEGPIGALCLNRPDRRNAMSPEMGKEIAQAVEELNAVAGLRVVLVRGAGKGFSSGGDFALLEQRTKSPGEQNRRAMRAFYGLYLSIRKLVVPTVAMIHGHALGAGLCFALGCDIRVAARGAKLGVTFVRVGLHPGMGATSLLQRAVGQAKAAELLLTGRIIEADEAERIGLVSRVVHAEELEQTARSIADEIALGAPVAIAQLKATLAGSATRTLDETLEREAACQAIDYATDDMAEAIAAFKNKRRPVFVGK